MERLNNLPKGTEQGTSGTGQKPRSPGSRATQLMTTLGCRTLDFVALFQNNLGTRLAGVLHEGLLTSCTGALFRGGGEVPSPVAPRQFGLRASK